MIGGDRPAGTVRTRKTGSTFGDWSGGLGWLLLPKHPGTRVRPFVEKATAAVGDKYRLAILLELAQKGRLCCADVQELTGLSQPCCSHHLKLLADSGLITYQREGKFHYYSLNREKFGELSEFFNTLS
jgi:DNA-binding transcriptional ArsR family regulator